MQFAAKALTVRIVAAALAGCSREGDLDVGAGGRRKRDAFGLPDGGGYRWHR